MEFNKSIELLEDAIFTISDSAEFNELALAVYAYQVKHCFVYGEFVKQLRKPHPTHYSEIPFLPISFFKTHTIQHTTNEDYPLFFLSSGTTHISERSKHAIAKPELYTKIFTSIYQECIGAPSDQIILALLPNYQDNPHSSLIYMVDELIKQTQSPLSGFLLDNPEAILTRYNSAINLGKKVVIFGVSYALLDLAEKKIDVSQAHIIETGGMKGRRKEITKEALHAQLRKGLNVPFVSSEYGMTELLSQAYSNHSGLFSTPPWMKIICRETNDPFAPTPEGKTGGINVIDLGNLYSCSFIATQDLGKREGDFFRVMGRFDQSDIRGCNLLVE